MTLASLVSLASWTGCSPLNQSGRTRSRQVSHVNPDCPLEFHRVGFCAQLEFPEPPRVGQETSFRLTFWKKGEGSPEHPSLDPALSPFVELRMEMRTGEHGSVVTLNPSVDAEGLPISGVFDAERAFFTMTKLWKIEVKLRGPDGEPMDQATHEIFI